MRQLLIGLSLILISLGVACGGDSSSTPKLAEVSLSGASIGTGLFPVMKRVNRACTFPGEVIMTPDNEPYMLRDGTPIEILEWEKGCKAPKGGAVKVRVLDSGIVGWLVAGEVAQK